MAKLIFSYANEIQGLESLVTATEEHLGILPTCGPHRQALVDHLGKIREAKARRDSAMAGRQKATQDLQQLFSEGQELAGRLRNAVKIDLGMKNEQLVQFGISPQRKRRRSKPPVIEKPAEGAGAAPGKEVATA